MKPYIVLGTYHPLLIEYPIWKAWKIGRHLTNFTASIGLTPLPGKAWKLAHGSWAREELHAEVRKRNRPGSQGTQWHQDGDMDPGVEMNHALVTWADVAPTEFKVGNKVYQPKPFEIVIARNLGCFHRRPPDAPIKRFLFRQRVVVPNLFFPESFSP